MLYYRIRAAERAALEGRVSDAYARAPQLVALDERRQRLVADVGAGRISAAEGCQMLDDLSCQEQGILERLGLPKDYLTLHYQCEKCRDTGYVGDAVKAPCACRLQKRESMASEAGINARETFEAFSEEIHPDGAQRQRAVNAMRICRQYAESLPHPIKPNLLILGMPGLGKSYLGNAVAYAAIQRGVDAARITAYRFVQDILSDIRERTANARRYQNVPLLVLDDLGSEPDVPNVSDEWLFAVINERALTGKACVFITNLSLKQLQQRYGERIMSRLCDQSTTVALQLTGANLRTSARG